MDLSKPKIPLIAYGMIGLSSLVLAYVTLLDSSEKNSNDTEPIDKEEPKEEEPIDEEEEPIDEDEEPIDEDEEPIDEEPIEELIDEDDIRGGKKIKSRPSKIVPKTNKSTKKNNKVTKNKKNKKNKTKYSKHKRKQ